MYTFRMEKWTFNSIKKLNINYRALNAKMEEIENKLNGVAGNGNVGDNVEEKIPSLVDKFENLERNTSTLINRVSAQRWVSMP